MAKMQAEERDTRVETGGEVGPRAGDVKEEPRHLEPISISGLPIVDHSNENSRHYNEKTQLGLLPPNERDAGVDGKTVDRVFRSKKALISPNDFLEYKEWRMDEADRTGWVPCPDHICRLSPVKTSPINYHSDMPCMKFRLISYKSERVPCFGPVEPFWTESKIIDGICLACRWVFDHIACLFEGKTVHVEHWATVNLMRLAAKAGCNICKMIAIRYDSEMPDKSDPARLWSRIAWQEPKLMLWEFLWQGNMIVGPTRNQGSFQVFLYENFTNLPWFDKVASTNTFNRTKILGFARECLHDCEAQHTLCGPHRVTLPTRLLEVNPSLIRLRRGCEIPTGTKYAALSHCWGVGGVTFKLTKDSFATFHTEIPLDSLPRTFQDAIQVSINLGIQYLWIDSLCIIQDDPFDWRAESVTMSDVYGNSFVTLSASAARNSEEGFLHYDTSSFQRLHVRIRFRQGNKATIRILEPFVPDMVPRLILDSILAQRGWALQERFLSPRILHFTSNQLLFECNKDFQCETFPHGIPDSLIRYHSCFPRHLMMKSSIDHWDQILAQYTRCTLTRRQDILVAIAGIIKKLKQERQDECVAGIWLETSRRRLLWSRRHRYRQRSSMVYTAPSWSWASGLGGLRPNRFRDRTLRRNKQEWWVEVLRMSVCLVGTDPLGELSGGSLSIACREMMNGKIQPISYRTRYDESHTFKIPTSNVVSWLSIHWDTIGSELTDVFLVRFFVDVSWRGSSGLVLTPTKQKRGQYKRIGLFEQEEAFDIHVLNQAQEEAFERFIDRGHEKWGVIEII